MKRIVLLAALAFALGGLSCASHNGPMERTGRAIDKAASKTVEAVGKGLEKTGEALESGGEKLQDKAQGK
ncbi:MAG: hypothetical protein ACOYXN_02760 [Acidobacteriota bacterium]